MEYRPPVDPEDPGRGPALIGVTWIFTCLAVAAVALRFHVRRKLAGSWAWDDWLMLIATICQVAGESLYTVSYHYGLGKHDYSLQLPNQEVALMKWAWIAMGPGQVTSIVARISITISLVGLFGIHAWFKWFLIVLTSMSTSLGIAMIVLSYTQAHPVEGIWNNFIEGVQRLNPHVFVYVGYLTQSLYTFSDVTYVLLPILIIWKLHMPLNRRIGLIVLMCFSLFTAVMSIMKTYTIHWQASSTVTDPIYRVSLQVIFASLEQTCVIIMGCVPSLRAIVTVHPGLSHIGKSLTYLIGRTSHTRSAAEKFERQQQSASTIGNRSFNYGEHRGGPYHDLGADEYTINMANVSARDGADIVKVGMPHKGSTENLVEPNLVRRTDQFIITYSKPEHSAEANV